MSEDAHVSGPYDETTESVIYPNASPEALRQRMDALAHEDVKARMSRIAAELVTPSIGDVIRLHGMTPLEVVGNYTVPADIAAQCEAEMQRGARSGWKTRS